MNNKVDVNGLERIQNSQELMQKIQRLHEIQTKLEQAKVWDLVNELLEIKAQMAMLFEKPKWVRRTKAQMQAERAHIQAEIERVAKEQEATQMQVQSKKPGGRKPKGEGKGVKMMCREVYPWLLKGERSV
ncbi:hypothetical protein [Helicobacter salomonis]|uniref:hypothetical protein n=1 Tax=Helicobacter salomonis TaxID=56878 RepID=UPI000CF0A110|nr:hypothetical protein [Helicobacter salomonis]